LNFTITLTDEQNNAILHDTGNLIVIACAGSGKTTVITRRLARLIRDGLAEPEEIVAFTFTVKAAEHMKNEIIGLLDDKNDISKMFVGTIHAYCLKILKEYYPDISEYYNVIDEDQQFMIFYQNYHYWKLDKLSDERKKDAIDRVIASMNLIKTERSLNVKEVQKKQPLLWDICLKYNEYLDQSRSFDYSDLLLRVNERLEKDARFRDYVNSRCRYLIVDEYQDIDNLQENIIQLISGKQNVCVVGDDDQSIYQFRGTNVLNMINFSSRYGAAEYPLSENRRSGKNILDLANELIGHNQNRIDKEMKGNKEGGIVQIRRFSSIGDEVKWIVDEIKKLNGQGIPCSEIAILLRSVSGGGSGSNDFKNNGEIYIEGLKGANIPYVAKGDCGLFKTPEIITIYSIFEYLIQKEDSCIIFDKLNVGLAFIEVLKTRKDLSANLSKNELLKLGARENEAEILSKLIALRDEYIRSRYDSISDLFFRILNLMEMLRGPDAMKLRNLGEFSNLIRKFVCV